MRKHKKKTDYCKSEFKNPCSLDCKSLSAEVYENDSLTALEALQEEGQPTVSMNAQCLDPLVLLNHPTKA